MTQQQLAKAIGVSQAAVAKWLGGKVPRGAALYRLAQQFNQPLESFLAIIPEAKATNKDKANVLRDPGSIPGNKLVDAFRQHYLSHKDVVRALYHAEDCVQIMERKPDGGVKFYYQPKKDGAELPLTNITELRKQADVKTAWQRLIREVRSLAEPSGKKAELAKILNVEPSRLSEWLAGKHVPGGEVTAALAEWVDQERAKQ